jgi:hypothetical protein
MFISVEEYVMELHIRGEINSTIVTLLRIKIQVYKKYRRASCNHGYRGQGVGQRTYYFFNCGER